MPNPQVTQKNLATASVTPQPRVFDEIKGKAREARVFFYFATADVPVSMPHSLGRLPTQWRVTRISRGVEAIETTTNSTTTLTTAASYANVTIGSRVFGAGMPAGVYVAAKASNTSLTLSAAATDATTNTRDFIGPPGTVYAPTTQGGTTTAGTRAGGEYDNQNTMTSNYIVLACSTANTWAEVLVS